MGPLVLGSGAKEKDKNGICVALAMGGYQDGERLLTQSVQCEGRRQVGWEPRKSQAVKTRIKYGNWRKWPAEGWQKVGPQTK